MPKAGKRTLLQDPHREPERRNDGPGKPDEEPVEKAKPEAEVKEHAERTERNGRPADDAGERTDLAERVAPEEKDHNAG